MRSEGDVQGFLAGLKHPGCEVVVDLVGRE
jgi:hypothetical protein